MALHNCHACFYVHRTVRSNPLCLNDDSRWIRNQVGKTTRYHFTHDYLLLVLDKWPRIATQNFSWQFLLLLHHREDARLQKNHVCPTFSFTLIHILPSDTHSSFLWGRKAKRARSCLLTILWLQVEPRGRAEHFWKMNAKVHFDCGLKSGSH